MTTMTIEADYAHGTPARVRLSVKASTMEDAEIFAAQFPKSKMGTYPLRGDSLHKAVVWISIKLDDAGIDRYRAARQTAEKLGVQVAFAAYYSNSYATEAAFHAAIGY